MNINRHSFKQTEVDALLVQTKLKYMIFVLIVMVENVIALSNYL